MHVLPDVLGLCHGVNMGRQVVNPANGEVIAKVPSSKGPETRAAIASAASVFPKWSGLPAKERSKILRKCAGQNPYAALSPIRLRFADACA
jgi:succinate-semialdehyde dehydrogenase/glutarate-semialdehyde dehydrogenase